jgi:hypothetical protein
VGADGHVVLDRPAHAAAHGGGVAGMPAAGDVGGADQGQQLFVGVAAFAEVGIQIDVHGVPYFL